MMFAILLTVGCSRREPEPIRITIAGPDQLVSGGVVHNRRELQAALRDRVRKYGMANPVIFEVKDTAIYSDLVPALDLVSSCGFWRYELAIRDGSPGQEFWRYPGDGPPNVDIDIDFATGQTLIDGTPTSETLEGILNADTGTYYRVWILAAGTTTVSRLLETLEDCSKHSRVLPLIVPREDRIANQTLHGTADSRADASARPVRANVREGDR